jgi:hypothetical protein
MSAVSSGRTRRRKLSTCMCACRCQQDARRTCTWPARRLVPAGGH